MNGKNESDFISKNCSQTSTNSNKERLTLIATERALLNDRDGSYRQKLLETVIKYHQFVHAQMNEGLNPQEFAVFSKLKLALESAKKIIINFK
ncbi:MAG: hypothetical protein LBB11_01500 [Puniceicoccales bacterium]|jgi:septum formation topological specificity factor MinE|nr:hypothetical protein [Puniceicoccales bacterium]